MTEYRKDVPPGRGLLPVSSGLAGDDSFVSAGGRSRLEHALRDARQALLEHQLPDGSWSGQPVPSTSTTACYVLLDYWLDRPDDEAGIRQGAVQYLRQSQQWDGGWGEPGKAGCDVSTSVLAYFALKLAGHVATDPLMVGARDAILSAGGVPRCDGLTRFYLALFGQLGFDSCPPLPPELLLLPRWMPGNIHRLSHWTRSLVVPLSIIWAQRPRKVLAAGRGIEELFSAGGAAAVEGIDASAVVLPRNESKSVVERFLTGLDRCRIRLFRKSALETAERWIVDRMSQHHGLSGSFEATVLAIIALLSRGHVRSAGPLQEGILALERSANTPPLLTVWEQSPAAEGTAVCFAPSNAGVFDSALAVRALATGYVPPESQRIRRGIEWLLRAENSHEGDWSHQTRAEASGWSREPANHFVTSVVTTAAVLLALREQFAEKPPSSLVTDDSMVAMIRANSLNLAHRQIAVLDRVAAASRRARRWLMALQNADGGWGHAQYYVGKVEAGPRLVHDLPNEDLTTPAATGWVLQALGAWDMGCGQASVDRGISYLRSTQQEAGHWSAAHDAGAIETTWSAIEGLRSVGLSRRDSTLSRAAEWLRSVQREDGGWSEQRTGSCPFATAYAILGLIASGYRNSDLVGRGVQFLLRMQLESGDWMSSANSAVGLNPFAAYRGSIAATAVPLQALSSFARSAGARR